MLVYYQLKMIHQLAVSPHFTISDSAPEICLFDRYLLHRNWYFATCGLFFIWFGFICTAVILKLQHSNLSDLSDNKRYCK